MRTLRGNGSRSLVRPKFRSSTRHESAVDGEYVSGYPGCIAGGKEGGGGGDVRRFPDASGRVKMAEAIGSALLSLPVSGPDGGWRGSVHSDAIGGPAGRTGGGGGGGFFFCGRVG